jgi:cation diffusion facilitator CzcD-associated flavoprotein CzcO
MVYLPLPEETGHTPTEKYVHGPEILAHCQRIAKQFGLGEDALFHTEVTGLAWDEARTRWVIATSRGDRLTAQFVGSARSSRRGTPRTHGWSCCCPGRAA